MMPPAMRRSGRNTTQLPPPDLRHQSAFDRRCKMSMKCSEEHTLAC